MRLLYSNGKIYKNYQINVGNPYELKFKPVKEVVMLGDLDGEKKQDLFDNADALILEARKEAEDIVEQAKIEAEEIKQNAYEEGKQTALEEAYEKCRNTYGDLMNEAENIRISVLVQQQKLMEGIEEQAVEMIMEVASKVIGKEMLENREYIFALVKEAIENCNFSKGLILRVSNEDYCFVLEHKEHIESLVEEIEGLEIKKDSTLRQGGCVVESRYGSVDTSINTKLRLIKEAFNEIMGR